MADRSKRAAGLWAIITALLLVQAAWAGAQAPPPGGHAPEGGHETLWLQDVSATTPWPHICQDFGTTSGANNTYIADDFTTSHVWKIDTIVVPGDTWGDPCFLSCAYSLSWAVYADDGGKPAGHPDSSVPAPVWSASRSPSDPEVTLKNGSGGNPTNVTLTLSSPFLLSPGTWWLVFYPTLNHETCSCYYGRQPSDTTNGHDAQVINPGGGLSLPATWTSVRSSDTFLLGEQDMAFSLEGWNLLWLGDQVWYDTDQDGIQDPAEPGVPGVWADWYDNGSCSGVSSSHAYTDQSGKYLFAQLPGEQCLHFDIPQGWSISPMNQGTDDTVDSDALPDLAQIRDINLEGDDTSQDVGVFVAGSISGRLWCDADCDRSFDAGEELAGSGVDLYLDRGCLGGVATLEDREVTNASGRYSFTGLYAGPPGDPVCYNVEVDLTTVGNCRTPLYTLSRRGIELDANHPTDTGNSFPLSKGLRVAGRVWYDPDEDGLQEQDEPGLKDMTASLFRDGQCNGQVLKTASTNSAGRYCFDGLAADSYCVSFILPAGYAITAQDQGSDDTLDSDVSPLLGSIPNIAVATDRLYESMGVYAQGLIGGHVFCDGNTNDRYDAGEGLKDVLVSQIDDDDCDGTGDGDQADLRTDADGLYRFGLRTVGPPGDPVCYTVHVDTSTVGTCSTPVTPTSWAVELEGGDGTHLDVDFGFRRILAVAQRLYLPLVAHKHK